MEYHITFTDGSNAFLAHHGVKGMKWGKWNAETQAKYGMNNADGAGGGGGGGLEEDEENDEKFDKEKFLRQETKKLDTDKFGFENSKEGRKAAYEEAGFNPKWSRERGLQETYKNFAENLMPGPNTAKDFNVRAKSALRQLGFDLEMTSSLKTKQQKKIDKDYKDEVALTKAEFSNDPKEMKKQLKRTDDFYGKNGKKARAVEAQRRRKNSEKLMANLRKNSVYDEKRKVWVSKSARK